MSRSLTLSKTVIVDLCNFGIENLPEVLFPGKKIIGVYFPSYDCSKKTLDRVHYFKNFCDEYFEKDITESIFLELLIQDSNLALKLATKNNVLDYEEKNKINKIVTILKDMHIATVTLIYNTERMAV